MNIINNEIISNKRLRVSTQKINAPLAANARVFEFTELEQVFIMESDLYGNEMPEDSCFLAFYGKNGLIGKHLTIETLKISSMDDIRKMVSDNNEG